MRQKYVYIGRYVFYVYLPVYKHQIKPSQTIDIDNARNLDIGTINCDQVDTDTMARLKLSKYSYLFFYFRFRPGWELDSLRNLRPCVRVDHHPITNCEIFIQPFAQPLCLIETPDRIKHFKTLYIHSPLFKNIRPIKHYQFTICSK